MSEEKNWKIVRLELLIKVNRLDLTLGARLLWTELAFNWCWNDRECCPSLIALAEALRVNVNSVARWAKELVDTGLMTKKKYYRGWRFILSDEIPSDLLVDQWRFNNGALTRRVKKKAPVSEKEPIDDLTQCGEALVKREWENTEPKTHSTLEGNPPLPVGEKCPKIHSFNESGYTRLTRVYRSGMNRKRDEHKKKKEEEKMGNQRNADCVLKAAGDLQIENARCARSCEGTSPEETEDEKQRTYAKALGVASLPDKTGGFSEPEKQRTYVKDKSQPEDPSELMADLPTQPKKAPRKKRAPDLACVTTQHDMRGAGKPSTGSKVSEPTGPPVWKPKDVLALLRGEVEAKFGAGGCRGMPLNLTKVDQAKIQNTVLNKYSPDTVISMVRVLVWDWEIARASIFPFRPQVRIPTIESLVQYQETLASVVDTGLKYTGASRGVWKTYASRYLVDANPSVVEPDPF